jgi:hypothetical protein
MILESTVQFHGELGAHLTFAEAPCPGRVFRVVETERGALSAVRCEICHRVFSVQETRLSDPLSEELFSLRLEEGAVAAITATYRYRHGSEDCIAEIPTKWFRTAQDAYRVYKGTTEEAALMAWPWSDVNDRLEEATITYSLRRNESWCTMEKHPIAL